MDFVSALVGAFVGGVATFAASWWQTRRVLEHERLMVREEREAQDLERRLDDQRGAAVKMLTELARLLAYNPRGLGGGMTVQQVQKFGDVLEALVSLGSSAAPLADRTCRERWAHLTFLAVEFARRDVVPDKTAPDQHSWTRSTKLRAAQDLHRYGCYVRDSLVASIDGSPIPERIDPPVLAREDGIVWNWDPDRPRADW